MEEIVISMIMIITMIKRLMLITIIMMIIILVIMIMKITTSKGRISLYNSLYMPYCLF